MPWLIDERFSDITVLGGTCSRGTKFFLIVVCMEKHRQCGPGRAIKEDFFHSCLNRLLFPDCT